jgi:hypothetical protein
VSAGVRISDTNTHKLGQLKEQEQKQKQMKNLDKQVKFTLEQAMKAQTGVEV